jgi:hypothetical protein
MRLLAITPPQLRKFIHIPGLIVTLNEMDATYRQIFTDGRPLPPIGTPAFKGYSVGKWEGETLVVESTGFRMVSGSTETAVL